jgi:hypothetical protein
LTNSDDLSVEASHIFVCGVSCGFSLAFHGILVKQIKMS